MKRKVFTVLVIIAGLSFTACQDETMDELIQDTELNQTMDGEVNEGGGTGSGGSGDPGNGDNPPPSGN